VSHKDPSKAQPSEEREEDLRELADRVTEIVADALDLEGEARTSFVDRACGPDAELQREVESLLAEDGDGEPDFLAVPAAEQIALLREAESSPTGRHSQGNGLPEHIGPYKIQRRLGTGGMGIVYLAEQIEPIRRGCRRRAPVFSSPRNARLWPVSTIPI